MNDGFESKIDTIGQDLARYMDQTGRISTILLRMENGEVSSAKTLVSTVTQRYGTLYCQSYL